MNRMTLRRFGRIVARVMETLPDEFLPYLDNVVVDVELEPDNKTLRRLDLTREELDDDPLYGLFDPLELPSMHGDAIDTDDMLHRLVIYKRPLEEDFPERRDLLLEIRKTVIHELAHHFGFTERDLDRFEAKDDPFRDDLTERLDDGDS